MFQSRHWRNYEACCNKECELGQQLVKPQNKHFKNEGLVVQLSMGQLKIMIGLLNIVSHVDNNENTTLGANTKLNE